jgi:hypothetical protein
MEHTERRTVDKVGRSVNGIYNPQPLVIIRWFGVEAAELAFFPGPTSSSPKLVLGKYGVYGFADRL